MHMWTWKTLVCKLTNVIYKSRISYTCLIYSKAEALAFFLRYRVAFYIKENADKSLKMMSNLSSISSDDLKIFSHLRHLSLTRNQLQTTPADLLVGLSNLYVLDLTGNKLKALHWRVFGNSPLVELTLADNLLSELHADCLPINSSLQRLDLASNRFTLLPVAFLQRLGNLQSFDFKNNQLEELTPVLDKPKALLVKPGANIRSVSTI
ncbi:leucine-rich repeat serine/threonine-protein kinase 1-like isoform X3 [Danio rerio]|uniref:Leucine-rich repeat serine/threonine-protein kinase 1-like isoform X3 n=1 Tax=Danio rerio TaxID=7955 RepID=A0AC58I5N1_DANRE